MTVFVTGGLGFIGSNFVFAHLKKHPADTVVILDNYSYAANSTNILGLHEDYRVIVLRCDIRNINRLDQFYYDYDPKITYHFAAESHVDNSIAGDDHFISTNVEGTHNILKCVKKFGGKLAHVSTDEVYGEVKKGSFYEISPLQPNSPYAASKAAADLRQSQIDGVLCMKGVHEPDLQEEQIDIQNLLGTLMNRFLYLMMMNELNGAREVVAWAYL